MNYSNISDTFYNAGKADVIKFDSGSAGPIVLIASGVHGNEIWPIHAVDDLLDLSRRADELSKWKLIVVPNGNPNAVQLGLRGTGGRDLNRSFWEPNDGSLEPNDWGTIEHRRAIFLKWIITSNAVTHILDLHSLSWPSRVPFLYCPEDPEKIAFAQKLWVSHIVIGWAKLAKILKSRWIDRPLRPGLADYGNTVWATALTFEAGTHDSPDARSNTRIFLANVLAVLGMDSDTSVDLIGWEETVLIDMDDVYLWNNSKGVQFEWVIEPMNFMEFSERTLVARDHNQDIYMEAGTILIQPKAVSAMKPWEEAFFIWRPRSQ